MRLRCGAVGPGAINDGGVPARCTLGALMNPWENNYPYPSIGTRKGTRLGADLRQFFFCFCFWGTTHLLGRISLCTLRLSAQLTTKPKVEVEERAAELGVTTPRCQILCRLTASGPLSEARPLFLHLFIISATLFVPLIQHARH